MPVEIRRARTPDVPSLRRLMEPSIAGRVLLAKAPVQYYEDVQEFWVAECEGRLVGCGALHVLWEDLAEIRSLAVDDSVRRAGVGGRLVERLLGLARELGVGRVFVLTFETAFFGRYGFRPIEGTAVSHAVYDQLLESFDEGVAEFLELERVKPNTLGNTRMLCAL